MISFVLKKSKRSYKNENSFFCNSFSKSVGYRYDNFEAKNFLCLKNSYLILIVILWTV